MLDFYKKDEKERLENNKRKCETRKQNKEKVKLADDLKAKRQKSKKPKVKPVNANEKNARKMEKMLKKMTLAQESAKKKKIQLHDSSDSDSGSDNDQIEDIAMDIDQIGTASKKISK